MPIPVSQINPLKKDRKPRDTKAYRERETALMEDMRANGLLNPIKVYVSGLKYQLISGQTRLNAALRLGWQEIEADVIEGEMTETRLRVLELSENQLHEPFDHFAVADIASELMKLNGWTVAELCRNVPALNPATLSKAFTITDGLSDELKAFLKDGMFGSRLGYALARLPKEQQSPMYEQVKHMKVERAEAHISAALGKKKTKGKAIKVAIPGLSMVLTLSDVAAARAAWDKFNAALQRLEKTGFPLDNLPGLLKS